MVEQTASQQWPQPAAAAAGPYREEGAVIEHGLILTTTHQQQPATGKQGSPKLTEKSERSFSTVS